MTPPPDKGTYYAHPLPPYRWIARYTCVNHHHAAGTSKQRQKYTMDLDITQLYSIGFGIGLKDW